MAALVGYPSSSEESSTQINELQNGLDQAHAHLVSAAKAIDPNNPNLIASPPPPSPSPPPPPPPSASPPPPSSSPPIDVSARLAAKAARHPELTAAVAAAAGSTHKVAPVVASSGSSGGAAAVSARAADGTSVTSWRSKCHKDCGLRGTCNEALGRCHCPPFYGGDDCSQPLFPSCVDQWGLKPPVAVCGIHIQPAFPTTCECVWECHSLGLDARQECVVDPKPGQTLEDARRSVKERMGWMPVIADEKELAMTRRDANVSIEQKLCSGRGIKSIQLPYEFYPKTGEVRDGINQRQVPQCRCFPGYTGPNCEIKMDDVSHMHKCFNGCSGRGQCLHNVCKCQPGAYGIDCSMGLGDPPLRLPGAPPSAAALIAAKSRAQGASATDSAGEREAPRPRIYVYDMPPRFTSWLGAFRRGDWTRDHWYGVDVILHQQLLRSRYRTLDPEKADFFFIPLHLSLGFYSHRYYFKHFTMPAAKPLRDAINYVKQTWPYFARSGGKDHIMVMTQDQGNRFVRQTVPEATPLILIHHWGAPRSCIVDGSGQGDHIVGHDITVPPFHGEQVSALSLPVAQPRLSSRPRPILLLSSFQPLQLLYLADARSGIPAHLRTTLLTRLCCVPDTPQSLAATEHQGRRCDDALHASKRPERAAVQRAVDSARGPASLADGERLQAASVLLGQDEPQLGASLRSGRASGHLPSPPERVRL